MRASLFGRRAALAAVLAILVTAAIAPAASAAGIVVDSLEATSAVDGVCTLPEAVVAATTDAPVDTCAAGSGVDTITFSVAGTITLTATLELGGSLGIDGGGEITLDGGGTVQVIRVDADAEATLDGLTVTGGAAFDGGGLVNDGSLTIIESLFIDNNADNAGGALVSSGELTILSSTFLDNTAGDGSGNGLGGAIATNGGTLLVSGSTFAGNEAGVGGAIWTQATTTIANSTIANNVAIGFGGGVNGAGVSLTLIHVTVSGNEAAYLGGISLEGTLLHLTNSLVAGNIADEDFDDIDGVPTSDVGSVIGVPDGLTVADILDPAGLLPNGGPTDTIALVRSATNPAVDTADAAACAATPISSLDQRGLPRSGACDVGAYELQPLPAPTASPFIPTTPPTATIPNGSSSGPDTILGWLIAGLLASAGVIVFTGRRARLGR